MSEAHIWMRQRHGWAPDDTSWVETYPADPQGVKFYRAPRISEETMENLRKAVAGVKTDDENYEILCDLLKELENDHEG